MKRIRVYSVKGQDLGLRRQNQIEKLLKHKRAQWREVGASVELLEMTGAEREVVREERIKTLEQIEKGLHVGGNDRFYQGDTRKGEWHVIQANPDTRTLFSHYEFKLEDQYV